MAERVRNKVPHPLTTLEMGKRQHLRCLPAGKSAGEIDRFGRYPIGLARRKTLRMSHVNEEQKRD